MRRRLLVLALAMGLWPMVAGAVTRDDFLARTDQDLLHLCAASPTDPMYTAAINFCQGYWVGAYQYYQMASAGPEGRRFICPPEPQPTRDQAVKMWIAWAREHPQNAGEPPVDNIFQFAAAQWPCRC
jgi:Rap1a immunity proteins